MTKRFLENLGHVFCPILWTYSSAVAAVARNGIKKLFFKFPDSLSQKRRFDSGALLFLEDILHKSILSLLKGKT